MYVIRDLDDANTWAMYVKLRGDPGTATAVQFCDFEAADRMPASEVSATIALLHENYPGWRFAAEVAP